MRYFCANILARAELEMTALYSDALADMPGSCEKLSAYTTDLANHYFLVIASIVVHGSSIAVFTFGERIKLLKLHFCRIPRQTMRDLSG